MTPHDLRDWRQRLGMTQKQAADALGVSPRMLAYYETGERDGRAVDIPRTVALACAAVARGIKPWPG